MPLFPRSLSGHRGAGRRAGFTLTEVLVALFLGTVLIGLVYEVFTPAHRQGARIERSLSQTHALLLLHAALERDIQAAEEIAVESGSLVLKRYLGRDPHVDDYGCRETVCYTHEPARPVQREATIQPRADGGKQGHERGPVGSYRYGKVVFEKRSEDGLVLVRVEHLDPAPGDPPDQPLTFTVHPSLTRAGSFWEPIGFW